MKITVEFDDAQEFAEWVLWKTKKTIKEAENSRKTPLRNYFLTVRTENALIAAGIQFVEDVVEMSDGVLMKIPNMGKKAISEIHELRKYHREKLAEMGILTVKK